MCVTHVTASLSTRGGGIPIAIKELACAQASAGTALRFLGLEDDGESLSGWPGGEPPLILPVRRFPGFAWGMGLAEALIQGEPALIHVHGLWTHPSLAVPWAARRARVPWMISPHGMLDSWALANSKWKKRIAAVLYENAHLRGAACLHALCDSEARSMRSYGLRNPVCVIPNGVELPNYGSRIADRGLKSNEWKTLLFLGRLHSKKGLVNALRAWAGICNTGAGKAWRLVIAGWDQGGHERELKELATELNIRWTDDKKWAVDGERRTEECSVVFAGPAFGEAKDRLLRQADAFILPSFSEGLPMAVLEAWAWGLPVLMTSHCNLPEGFAAGAAMECQTGAETLTTDLADFLDLPDADLREMGMRGRNLVEQRFSWQTVAKRMLATYQWILDGGEKPEEFIT